MESAGEDRGAADRLIDELVPEGVDWVDLVRAYPIPSLVVATAFGFMLGRNHGPALVAALTAFAGRQAARAVEQVLEEPGGAAAE